MPGCGSIWKGPPRCRSARHRRGRPFLGEKSESERFTPKETNKSDGKPYELGTKFTAKSDGIATGVRFFKAPSESDTHRGRLWDAEGKPLAEIEFAKRNEPGWQSATFKTPVKLKAGASYVVSVNYNSHYPYAKAADLPLRRDGPLTLDGGRFGPPGQAPSSEFGAVYFVDLIAESGGAPVPGLFELPPSSLARRERLVLVLFNHHEFVTVR